MEPSAKTFQPAANFTEHIIQNVYYGLQGSAESGLSNLTSCYSSPHLQFFEQSAFRLKVFVFVIPVPSAWAVIPSALCNPSYPSSFSLNVTSSESSSLI